jgi:hypothetical protein
MARQAVTLIIFLFIACLSSLCSSALGGGVFYACSDGTLKPSKFDIKKCLNFGIKDIEAVVSGDIKESGEESSDLSGDTNESGEKSSDLSGDSTGGDGLIPDAPVDDDAADPNLDYLDYFNRSRNRFSGNGVVTSASNAAECAKICFNDEVDMLNEGEKCQGFLSDDGSYCKLYPTIDSTTGEINSQHKAYRLKEGKEGGGAIVGYSTTRGNTNFASDGGPKYYGGRHDVNCPSGALSSFKFNKVGTQVNNSFTCVNSTALGGATGKQTPVNASGKKKGRNDMYWIDRHDINCGNNFLRQWRLDQWSRSMRVNYQCTTAETSDPNGCESLSAGGYSRHPHVGTWKGDEVKCPANKLLTQWKYDGDKINYRCCPKP